MSDRLTTWNEMLARVRRQAKDANAEDRIWNDEQLKAVIFDAVKDLARDVPDSLLDDHAHPNPLPFEVMSWDANLPTSPYYDAALEALALHKLMISDAADVKDESLARHWLTRYQQLTRGGGGA